MKIAIMSTMPPNTYSGGRYSAWAMAECLAYKKNVVYFITNNMPIFSKDFESYEDHNSIKFILTDDFDVQIEGDLDYVILVPNQDKNDYFYVMCRNFARKNSAKLVLLNFETPNWFNKYSPTPRDEQMWRFWKDACNDGCLVLSIAEESMKYAKEFYIDNLEYTRFDYWYPAMNSKVADCIEVKKEKRIISFIRFQDKHKGGGDIFDLFGEYLKGYTLVFVIGNGQISTLHENKLEFLSEKYGFNYEIKMRLSDEEKFREIKKAQLMLFPSYFEGYGYPPVEAQYCNTLCVAYDLPVLRETSGEGIVYCERGNIYAMKEALQKAIETYEEKDLKTNIIKCGSFQVRADDIHQILEKYLEDDYRNPNAGYLKVVKPEIKKVKEQKSQKINKKKEKDRMQAKPVKQVNISIAGLKEKVYRKCQSGINKCRETGGKIKRKVIKIQKQIFLRKMPIHLGTFKYDTNKECLYLKGWYLIWREIDRVEVLNSKGNILGYAQFGLKRKDIYEKYPQYQTMQLGWEFENTVNKDELDDFLRIQIVCSDGKIAWADFTLKEEKQQ